MRIRCDLLAADTDILEILHKSAVSNSTEQLLNVTGQVDVKLQIRLTRAISEAKLEKQRVQTLIRSRAVNTCA